MFFLSTCDQFAQWTRKSRMIHVLVRGFRHHLPACDDPRPLRWHHCDPLCPVAHGNANRVFLVLGGGLHLLKRSSHDAPRQRFFAPLSQVEPLAASTHPPTILQVAMPTRRRASRRLMALWPDESPSALNVSAYWAVALAEMHYRLMQGDPGGVNCLVAARDPPLMSDFGGW